MHIAYRRRDEKPQKGPLRGNIRRGRELWPKKLFRPVAALTAARLDDAADCHFLQPKPFW
jgi:hypothetical protein